MPSDRLRSIVPMFGGGTQYVETLDAILAFVEAQHPMTDEVVGWHRGRFTNVSSRESIMRRVGYLRQAGFLEQENDHWVLGEAGREYMREQDTAILFRLMCERNVGLRSLLYALSAGALTLAEISDQQLDTHPELGWGRGETDMARQRANWLRSMGLVQKQGDTYRLTDEGQRVIDDAVVDWATTEGPTGESESGFTADTYETVVQARAVDPEFRATVLARYDRTCPVSGVDHPGLIDVAHVLPWRDYPDQRAELGNVLALSKTHHAAFDQAVFTIDSDYRLRVNPDFETGSELLQRTIIDRAGEQLPFSEGSVEPAYFEQHNEGLAWV